MHLLCNIISLFILISFVKSSLKIFSPLSLMNRFSQNGIYNKYDNLEFVNSRN